MILPPAELDRATGAFASDTYFAADAAADSALETVSDFASRIAAEGGFRHDEDWRLVHALTDRARDAEACRRHARAKFGWELRRLLNEALGNA